jgi:hypothetical protein
MGINIIDEWDTKHNRSRHDPTNSFTPQEFAAIEVFMQMPIDKWVNIAKAGKASKEQLKEWMDKLDKICPGYGEMFLGDMALSEEEQILRSQLPDGGYRPPINWERGEDGKFHPYYGDINGEIEWKPPQDSTPNLSFKSQEELDAWKKLQDATYEQEKAKLDFLRIQEKLSDN